MTNIINNQELKITLEKNNEERLSLWLEWNNTIIYGTLVINHRQEDRNTNLTVFYREMSYSNSRNFFKKEMNKTDQEILISRTIDRSIRPLLKDFNNYSLTLTVMLLQGPANLDMGMWAGFFLFHSAMPNGDFLGYPYGKKITTDQLGSLVVGMNSHGIIMMEGSLQKVNKPYILEILQEVKVEQKKFINVYQNLTCYNLLLPEKQQQTTLVTYERLDRNWLDIRPINIEINKLSHMTSVTFKRGITEVLVVMGMNQSENNNVQLLYRFHPFSVNESGETYGNSRREKGHGDFAKNCFNTYWKNSISYKIISEVLSCNGSSSMATVCGTSLCLALECGEELISGITGGKISSNFVIDLTEEEDNLSDCDLKVVNNEAGLICGIFMDTKHTMTIEDLNILLDKIIASNIVIIQTMKSKIDVYSGSVQIKKSKIGVFVGKNGIHIKEMQKVLKCNIKVFDSGYICLSSKTKEDFSLAEDVIKSFNTLENNQKITAIIRGIKHNIEITELDNTIDNQLSSTEISVTDTANNNQAKEVQLVNINLGLLNFSLEKELYESLSLSIGDIISGIVIMENNKIRVEQIEKIIINK